MPSTLSQTPPLSRSKERGTAEYRAFPIGIDGHFIGFEPLFCASDDEAIAKAKRMVVGHAVELWCGARLVLRIEAAAK
jgi:hypothetical protein